MTRLSSLLLCFGALLPASPGPAEAQTAQESEVAVAQDERKNEVIAGLRGLTIISTLSFDAAPDLPHNFETNYIFPARARWWMSFEDEQNGYRRAEYRYGDRVFVYGQGSSKSEELTELNQTDALRRMELRRALFLYPDGFEWKVEAGVGRAELLPLADESSVGSLYVDLDAEGRPKRMRVITPENQEQESLVVDSWSAKPEVETERQWPKSMRLVVGEQGIWSETVQKVDPGRRYIDSFFIPADRRAGASRELGADTNSEVRQIDLPVFAYRQVELPADTSWSQALELGQEFLDRENRPGSALAGRLDDDVRFEIDARGRPTFAVLHLKKTSPLPKGWKLTEARSGLMIVLDEFAELGSARIGALLRAIPVGSRPTPAYARTVGQPGSLRVQVLLPLVPVD